MIQNPDRFDGADDRVIDYSDPALIPHETHRPYRRNDSGGFVAAGIAVGMVLVGGFLYAGYLTEGVGLSRHSAPAHTALAAPGDAAKR